MRRRQPMTVSVVTTTTTTTLLLGVDGDGWMDLHHDREEAIAPVQPRLTLWLTCMKEPLCMVNGWPDHTFTPSKRPVQPPSGAVLNWPKCLTLQDGETSSSLHTSSMYMRVRFFRGLGLGVYCTYNYMSACTRPTTSLYGTPEDALVLDAESLMGWPSCATAREWMGPHTSLSAVRNWSSALEETSRDSLRHPGDGRSTLFRRWLQFVCWLGGWGGVAVSPHVNVRWGVWEHGR
ncbi:hypothetical protein LIA77_06695 [Sarocladium implicatum]|nr:hypothetical protein LIA77_06695 [Sarocladium implicatum]